jgi:hypothetical protein
VVFLFYNNIYNKLKIMRRFDKKTNLNKANLLAEQRYLHTKGIINENGPLTDVDGITDSLLRHYTYALETKKDLGPIDAQVYDLMKKTLSVHGADLQTKKAMYLTMAEKLRNTNLPALLPFAQTYNTIGKSFESSEPMGDGHDFANHVNNL